MIKIFVLVVLGACGAPPSIARQPAAAPEAAPPATSIDRPFDVTVVAVDGYANMDCDGVAPHVLAASIDGVAVGQVTIPCFPGVAAPPRSFRFAPLPLALGRHTIAIWDTDADLRADETVDLVMPVVGPGEVVMEPNTIYVQASETGFFVEPPQFGLPRL